jgi:hypothetical protein
VKIEELETKKEDTKGGEREIGDRRYLRWRWSCTYRYNTKKKGKCWSNGTKQCMGVQKQGHKDKHKVDRDRETKVD